MPQLSKIRSIARAAAGNSVHLRTVKLQGASGGKKGQKRLLNDGKVARKLRPDGGERVSRGKVDDCRIIDEDMIHEDDLGESQFDEKGNFQEINFKDMVFRLIKADLI